MRLRYPPGVSSTANAELRWAGSATASVLSGDVTVNRLAVTPGFDFGASLSRAAQIRIAANQSSAEPHPHGRAHTTTPELQMQTAVVRFSGAADLHLRGTAAKPWC